MVAFTTALAGAGIDHFMGRIERTRETMHDRAAEAGKELRPDAAVRLRNLHNTVRLLSAASWAAGLTILAGAVLLARGSNGGRLLLMAFSWAYSAATVAFAALVNAIMSGARGASWPAGRTWIAAAVVCSALLLSWYRMGREDVRAYCSGS